MPPLSWFNDASLWLFYHITGLELFLHHKFEAQRVIGQSKNIICLIDPQEEKILV